MEKKSKYNRRFFIGAAGCASLSTATFFSTLFNLQSISAASLENEKNSGDEEDYRALICIMLGGGNDSYNMIIPRDNYHYNKYKTTRSNLSIPQSKLLRINPLNYNEKELGFHPSCPELQSLFESEKLAIISNIGTLVEPTTKSKCKNDNNLPFGLFSHADQAKSWQTSIPQTSASTGWGGRLSDLMQSANTNPDISMNISLSGKNIFQLGNQSSEYSILPTGNGSIGIEGFGESSIFDQIRTSSVRSLLEKQYQDIFKQSYADVLLNSQNTHTLFSKAIENSFIKTEFSESDLSQQLKMVARTIKVRKELGVKRQTFFISFDGWDHHDELLENHKNMLSVFSEAVGSFQAALAEINLENNVTTFTVSDFARTLTSNGNGTDHAWGGNVLVIGGKVKGKRVYGKYPNLALNGKLMLHGGILIPQISTDEYFAELSLWFGAAKSDLINLFPNITNFYSPFSSQPPIGFLNIE